MFSRHAFTLIEILVVIAIIVTLMGLLLGVVNTTSAEIAATQSSIQQLSGSIEQYKTLNGKYPLQGLNNLTYSNSNEQRIASRNHELREMLYSISAEYGTGGQFAFGTDHDYQAPTPEILPGFSGKCECIVDNWDMPLIYKPFTAYAGLPSGWSSSEASKYKPPKPNSYQIWSAGPNMTYEQNSANGADSSNSYTPFDTDPDSDNFVLIDDITNWSKAAN